MNSFLSLVIKDLVQRAGGLSHLGSYTFVFPMQRAGLFLSHELRKMLTKDSTLKTIVEPQYLTIDQLMDSLCTLRPDEELRSVVELHHIYSRLVTNNPMPLDVFYGWGRQLLTDFSDVDMALLDAQSIFANSADAQELERTQLTPETIDRLRALFPTNPREKVQDSLREQFEILWRQIPNMYKEFQTIQQAKGIGYHGARMKHLIENFNTPEIAQATAGRTYVFLGFNYLLAGERRLMELLQERGQALFYWDYNSAFQTNRDAYKFISREMAHFPNCLPEAETKEQNHPITLISTAGTNAQSQFVHDWLREHHKPGTRTGIIIADESVLESVIYALPSEWTAVEERNPITGEIEKVNKVNITKGFPLRETQIFDQIIHAENPEQILETNLLSSVEEEGIEVGQTDKVLPWQTLLRLESEHQARKAYAQFRALIDDGTLAGINDKHVLNNLLRRYLETITMPFHGTPKAEIQVMGVLESRLLDFDQLLVLNVEEGILPRSASANGFVPYYLRKYYGMQTSEEEASIYAYNFFRLLRRCPDATILFAEGAADMSQRTMSRFLMQLLISGEYPIRKFRLTEASTILPFEPITLSSTQRSQKPFSPSALTSYLACPRQYYLGNVLGLKSPQQEGPILASNDFGTLVHATIQQAYQVITSGKLPAVIQADMINKFLADEKNLTLALQSAYEQSHLVMDEHTIENEVILRYAKRVLENDASLPYLKIVLMEKYHKAKLGNYEVGGTIDRLDIVEQDGHMCLRVVDYKTGAFTKEKLMASELASLFQPLTKHYYMLQTLIYCYILRHSGILNSDLLTDKEKNLPIMPVLLFVTRNLKTFDPHLQFKIDPNAKAAEYLPLLSYASIEEDFVERLTALVEEVASDAAFSLCQEGKCSPFCSFFILCNRKPPRTQN